VSEPALTCLHVPACAPMCRRVRTLPHMRTPMPLPRITVNSIIQACVSIAVDPASIHLRSHWRPCPPSPSLWLTLPAHHYGWPSQPILVTGPFWCGRFCPHFRKCNGGFADLFTCGARLI
jgi:hypothetical protein